MDKLSQKIIKDENLKRKAYIYLKHHLDKETSKPLKERDLDKIEKFTAYIAELSNNKRDNSENISRFCERYDKLANSKKYKFIHSKYYRKFVSLVSCIALIIGANCLSVYAYHKNIFSVIMDFSYGGLSVYFVNDSNGVEILSAEDDPFGIFIECSKNNIYPVYIPQYLPEGFICTYKNFGTQSSCTNMRFVFENKEKYISMNYIKFINESEIINFSDDNFSEIDVNGTSVLISEDSGQFKIILKNEQIIFFMFTKNISYDECYKIVESMI